MTDHNDDFEEDIEDVFDALDDEEDDDPIYRPTPISTTTRCGYVAIIGAPNAGKSTLLNRLVGSKLAIVTPKVQTTRNRILGVGLYGLAQLILCDTPGIFNAKEKFEKAMVASAFAGARDADVILLMIDAYKGICGNTQTIIDSLDSYTAPVVVVLNKIDNVDKARLPVVLQDIAEKLPRFDRVFMISASKGDGVEDLQQYLAEKLPESPWLYPEDHITDVPMRALAAEITREKLFMRLREEVPYSIAVETETWEEKKDGSVKISQVIYVRTEGQKKIVLGQRGEMLKTVGQIARESLTRLMERKVHLFLFVKVAENWKDNREFYESIGLDFE